MVNNFPYTIDNKRYHTLTYFYQHKFGCKIAKVSLNANFSCPNIDGKRVMVVVFFVLNLVVVTLLVM